MCFLLSFCSFSPNGEYIVWSLFHMALSLCDVVTVSKWLGARSTQNAFLCSCRKRAMKVKAPPTEYEHLISSGFFPENNDVIERKLSNEGINSIGLKRAKRKQKAYDGDYFQQFNWDSLKFCRFVAFLINLDQRTGAQPPFYWCVKSFIPVS